MALVSRRSLSLLAACTLSPIHSSLRLLRPVPSCHLRPFSTRVMSSDHVQVVALPKPFADQAPGTSGLRKKVTVFQQPHYTESFVQSIFDILPQDELKGSTLVVSGDGRFLNIEVCKTILRMAEANGIGKILMGQNFLMSTPAVSAVVRSTKAYGAIILTASHNPGGPTQDFGIKYNTSNGGPAPEKVTSAIFERSKVLKEYRISTLQPAFDINQIGKHSLGRLQIEVVDPTETYTALLKSIFDFEGLRALVHRKDFRLVYDTMHGVAGPYARRIFVKELGCPESVLLNNEPLPDFGGLHPDPNLTYAADLVHRMGLSQGESKDHAHGPAHSEPVKEEDIPDFGAAADGDADRNMILGRKFFVTPSDSVAIIAAYATKAIPYFARTGLHGVARSMPTSEAIDRVAAKLGVKCYEVPTGWKFFGNLMDAGRLSLCGEESFGTGSDHVREKDGVWAVLAWLSILQFENKDTPIGKLVSVQSIVEQHWRTFGRNYYSRYDYENVESAPAKEVMAGLVQRIADGSIARELADLQHPAEYVFKAGDEFSYTDPVDGSVSAHQGIRLMFTDGSRVVFRLSGTGSVGATIRVYFEKYETRPDRLADDSQAALASLITLGVKAARIQQLTGRDKPTVIT